MSISFKASFLVLPIVEYEESDNMEWSSTKSEFEPVIAPSVQIYCLRESMHPF